MNSISVTAFAPGSPVAKRHEIREEASFPCSFQMSPLPGASSIQLEVFRGEELVFRAELPAEENEIVGIELSLDENGEIHVVSPGRSLYCLPSNEDFDSLRPLSGGSHADGIDVCLVFDATTLVGKKVDRKVTLNFLLNEEDVWGPLSGKLEELVSSLEGSHGELRFSLIAFGDQPMPADQVKADELHPAFRLYPSDDERKLRPLKMEDIREQLQAVPTSRGGDFVDALADSLHAASLLRWRQGSRKLVVLVGDSPGYSTEHPVRLGGDICVRDRDVDIEAMRLHKSGVEILSVYLDSVFTNTGLEGASARREKRNKCKGEWHQPHRGGRKPRTGGSLASDKRSSELILHRTPASSVTPQSAATVRASSPPHETAWVPSDR